jgi:hypothetical protein
MFEAAREAMIEPGWRRNVRFVAYNNLWGTGYIGQGNRPQPGIWFERDEGWLAWRMYDGGMPELYDNDWQPGKTDYRPWSPQIEAMNYYATQGRIFRDNPDYYWSTIVWDGGRVGNVWRGRRSTSKTFRYITRGQRWDFQRYEGWVQFVLWTTRPRSLREFRAPAFDEHSYAQAAFMALVRSVDRPWNNRTLREFWRFGDLVPNPRADHWWQLSDDQPEWIRDLERWYLLTADAKPPRQEWKNDTELRIYAQALVLGEEPERRWLIYAHAPLGAVPGVTVTLPNYGRVTLDSVPKSGSFFLLKEPDDSLEALIVGGPHELSLEADRRISAVGQTVRFDAAIAHAPEKTFTGFTWDFGDGRALEQEDLAPMEHSYEQAGEYLVTLRGHLDEGGSLTDQVAVLVGNAPDESVVYDLPLRHAFAWEGPWDDSGEPDHRLVTYRHVPNRGSLPSPVLVGGKFVEDEERGRVLELAGGKHDGVYMLRGEATNMRIEGYPNKTLALSFKAAHTDGRQVLYAEGSHHAGLNIYLDGKTLYAGAFAPVDGKQFDWHPVYGRNWDGDWISHEGIEAGRWYEIEFVFTDATEEVQEDKMHLHVDGERVASGPAARLPRTPAAPRLGRAHLNGTRHLLTQFHDGESQAAVFSGRLSDFRLINAP